MKIPAGYSGRLHAYANTRHDFIAWRNDSSHELFVNSPDEEYIYLGCTDVVNVEFKDFRAEKIKALQRQIEKERAESQFRINQMLGQIQELQALEVLP